MPELITQDTLGPVLEELRLAYRIRIAEKDIDGTIRVWLDGLTGLTAESVRAAAKRCIQTGEHFPRVKEVRELALDFMGRTNHAMPVLRGNPLACPICGAEPQSVEVTRPVRDPKNRYAIVVGDDGKPLMETVNTGRTEVYHDRAAHHVVDSLTE